MDSPNGSRDAPNRRKPVRKGNRKKAATSSSSRQWKKKTSEADKMICNNKSNGRNKCKDKHKLITRHTIRTKHSTILSVLEADGVVGEAISLLFITLVLLGFKVEKSKKEAIIKSLRGTTRVWKSRTGCTWIKMVKWKRDAYFATQKGQPLPSKPFKEPDNPAKLLGGACGKYCDFLKNNNPEFWELWLGTVQNGWAKGCPRPDSGMLKTKLTSTFADLTTASVPIEFKIQNEFLSPERKMNWVDEIAREEEWESILSLIRSPWHKVPEWGWGLEDKDSSNNNDDQSWEEEYKVPYEVKPIWEFTYLNPKDVIGQLRRTAVEAFANAHPMNLADRIELFMFSSSASYYTTRSEAGSLGEILNDEELLKGLRTIGGCVDFTGRTVVRKVNRERGDDYIRDEVVDQVLPLEDWETDLGEGETFLTVGKRKELRKRFAILWERLLIKAKAEPNNVRLVALAEALKVRVISASGAARSMVLKNMQKWMHSKLRKLPIFKLIGEPITAEYLDSQLFLEEEVEDDEGLMSGDYTAATNNVHSIYSEALGRMITDIMGLSNDETELFLDHLTGHEIEDPDSDPPTFKRQKRGQLMGSIISFPILCLLNATIVRMSFELSTGQTIRLSQLPAAINGDDVLCKCTPKTYKMWKIVAEHFGMAESVGKTFFSSLHDAEPFCQMNSKNFTYDATTSKLTATPFINWGLVKGMGRSEASSSGLEEDTMTAGPGARYHDLMDLAPTFIHKPLHKLFITYNTKILEEVRLPWYIPTWLGGVGLTGVKDASKADLKIVNGFIRNIASRRRGDKLLPWMQVPRDIGLPEKSWITRDLASKRLPKPVSTSVENFGVSTYNKALFEEGLNMIFDSTISLKDLYPATKAYVEPTTGQHVFVEKKDRASQRFSQAVKFNQKLWKRAYSAKEEALYRAPIKYKSDELDKIKVYESYATSPNHYEEEFDLLRWDGTKWIL